MAYEVRWEDHGVVFEFSHVVSIDDLTKATTDAETDARFATADYVLVDYRRIESCRVVPDEMNMVWAQDYVARLENKRVRKAVVTTRSDVLALARQYAHSYGPGAFEVRTFDRIEDARHWLSSPPGESGSEGGASP